LFRKLCKEFAKHKLNSSCISETDRRNLCEIYCGNLGRKNLVDLVTLSSVERNYGFVTAGV